MAEYRPLYDSMQSSRRNPEIGPWYKIISFFIIGLRALLKAFGRSVTAGKFLRRVDGGRDTPRPR